MVVAQSPFTNPLETVLSAVTVDQEPLAIGAFMPNREQLRQGERETKRLRKDPHRRRRFLNRVRSDGSVIRSAIATLDALLEHSNDAAAGGVFPSQARLARLAEHSVRTVQRHLKELRDAGYLLVYVYAANRNPETGRYARRKTNRYYFVMCKTPGNGHRVRRNRTSHLHDTDGVTNLLGIRNHRPDEGGGGSLGLIIENAKHLLRNSAPSAPISPASRYQWSDQKGCEECDYTRFVFDDAGNASPCGCMN